MIKHTTIYVPELAKAPVLMSDDCDLGSWIEGYDTAVDACEPETRRAYLRGHLHGLALACVLLALGVL